MKYLKGTLLLFVITLVLCIANAEAIQKVTLIDVKIPSFQGLYRSQQVDKWDETVQAIAKSEAHDSLTGDGRAIMAQVDPLFHANPSEWLDTIDLVAVDFDENSKQLGTWRLYLKSKKNLVTTATFTGAWRYAY